MDAIQILTVQLQKHPKVCVIYIYTKQSQCLQYCITSHSYNLIKVLLIPTIFTLCLCSHLGSSPEQHCLCWVTAIITSRISVPPQNATSSSHSCIQRWRTTRCIMPNPCTKLVLILRPPRLPLLLTTLAVTPRFHYTCSHIAHATDLLDFIKRETFFSLCLSLQQMLKLQACIKYCEQDNSAAKVSIHPFQFLFVTSSIELVFVAVSCLQSSVF